MIPRQNKFRLRTRVAIWLLHLCEDFGYWIADRGPHIWWLYLLLDRRDFEH